jgi:hypothetical protein
MIAMPALRQVQREWLDELAADDPRAIRSRRDLKRVNAWMLQPGIMARLLSAHHAGPPPRRILDLGSGDGTFMLRVAKRLAPRWSNVTVTMLDRQDIVSKATRDGFAAMGWRAEPATGDIFERLEEGGLPNFDVVTANLFLHHFTQGQLRRLLARVAALAPWFIACEPRRGLLPLAASRMLWLIGCNDVSRHDAVVSVEAGFDGRELSELWPEPDRWKLDEHAARLFTHCFIARRADLRPMT